jgi:hypothetical protein
MNGLAGSSIPGEVFPDRTERPKKTRKRELSSGAEGGRFAHAHAQIRYCKGESNPDPVSLSFPINETVCPVHVVCPVPSLFFFVFFLVAPFTATSYTFQTATLFRN